MREYYESDVLESVPVEEIDNTSAYYLPHSDVFKKSSTTTNLLVVFDGSAKSSNGYNLNDN